MCGFPFAPKTEMLEPRPWECYQIQQPPPIEKSNDGNQRGRAPAMNGDSTTVTRDNIPVSTAKEEKYT